MEKTVQPEVIPEQPKRLEPMFDEQKPEEKTEVKPQRPEPMFDDNAEAVRQEYANFNTADERPRQKFRNNKMRRRNNNNNSENGNNNQRRYSNGNSGKNDGENSSVPHHEHNNVDEMAEQAADQINISALHSSTMPELYEMAESLGIEGIGALEKHRLVYEILKANAEKSGMMYGSGYLEVLPDGFGFCVQRITVICHAPRIYI